MTEEIGRVAADGLADQQGKPRPVHEPLHTQAFADDPRVAQMREEAEDRRRAAAQRRSMAAWRATVRSYGEEMADDKDGDDGWDEEDEHGERADRKACGDDAGRTS